MGVRRPCLDRDPGGTPLTNLPRRSGLRPALAWAALFLAGGLTVWAYAPALNGPFVFDDLSNIVNSPALRWETISAENVSRVLDQSRLQRRPVANLTFALDHAAWGMDPRAFHRTNLLIHFLVGAALLWVTLSYLRFARRGSDPPAVEGAPPIWTVLPVAIFLLHPLNTQAVSYVVQRMSSLVALFLLLSFGSYLRARRVQGRSKLAWFAVALALWLLALGTKENALLLPAVVVLYEWCFHRDGWKSWLERRTGWRWTPRATVLMWSGVSAVFLVTALLVGRATGALGFSGDFGWRDFTGLERLLTQSRVHFLYLSLLLWPSPGRLNLDREFGVSHSLLDPPVTLVASWGILALLGLSVFLAVKRPRYGFPLLAYSTFHAIESGPVDLELVFEHRMYLPMTMLVLLGAVVLADLRPARRTVVGVAALLLCLPLAGWTHARNQVWGDELLLQEDIAVKSPNKARAQYNWAMALMNRNRSEEALPIAQRALTLLPEDPRPHTLMGRLLVQLERPEEAIPRFRSALRLDPANISAHLGLGSALAAAGDPVQAMEHYLSAGADLARGGNPWAALPILQAAVELQPESSVALNALGNAYLIAGFDERAAGAFQEAVRTDPNLATAWYNLGLASDALGRTEEALRSFREFVRVAPPELASAVQRARSRIAELEGGS